LSELDTFLEISRRLGYLEKEQMEGVEKKMTLADKMLAGLITSLKKAPLCYSLLTPHSSR
jgi:four helix bundle protein